MMRAHHSLQGLPFPVHALGPSLGIYGFNRKLLPWLRNNLDRFDGIVVGGLWQYHSIALWMAVRGTSHRYVVFPHGMLDPYFNRAYPWKFLKKVALLVSWPKDVCSGMHTGFCLHPRRSRGWLPKAFGTAREMVWWCRMERLDLTWVRNNREPHFFAFFRNLKAERFLLYLGRIHHKKGCDLLIEAFAKHAESDPALHLVIAGPDKSGWSKKLMALADSSWSGRSHYLAGHAGGRCEVGRVLCCRRHLFFRLTRRISESPWRKPSRAPCLF